MKNPFLDYGWITVNRSCNYRCPWCYAKDHQSEKSNLDHKLAKKLIRLIAETGLKHLFFIGGEPSLYPHLFELNRLAKSLKFETILVTNGSMLANDKFFDQLTREPFSGLNISLKSGNPKQHLAITGKNDFHNLWKGIKRAKRNGHTVSLAYVLGTPLKNNFLECMELASENGENKIWINFCTPCFDDECNVDTAQTMTIQESVDYIQKEYENIHRLTKGNFVVQLNQPLCMFPRNFIDLLKNRNQVITTCFVHGNRGVIFDTEGYILPCNNLCHVKIGKYGQDFHDLASFREFWINGKMHVANQSLTRYPSHECVSCLEYNECGGGCPLIWFAHKPETLISQRR